MATSRAQFVLDRTIFNSELYTRIQRVWFVDQPIETKTFTPGSTKRWFFNPDRADALAFDRQLSEQFMPALKTLFPDRIHVTPAKDFEEERQLSVELASPFFPDITPASDSVVDTAAAANNALSLTLLLDQISRNTLREDQQLIYTHFDRLSRALCRAILGSKFPADLAPGIKDNLARRVWFYMPLMHSENMEDHQVLADKFTEMKVDPQVNTDEAADKALNDLDTFEEKHTVILRQFGRYPHRNEAIGRTATREEQDWLEKGGERFTS